MNDNLHRNGTGAPEIFIWSAENYSHILKKMNYSLNIMKTGWQLPRCSLPQLKSRYLETMVPYHTLANYIRHFVRWTLWIVVRSTRAVNLIWHSNLFSLSSWRWYTKSVDTNGPKENSGIHYGEVGGLIGLEKSAPGEKPDVCGHPWSAVQCIHRIWCAQCFYCIVLPEVIWSSKWKSKINKDALCIQHSNIIIKGTSRFTISFPSLPMV